MKRLFLFIVVAFTFSSCEEAEGSTEYFVRVTVTNDEGIPIQNASVKMYTPVPSTTEWYSFTNDRGQVLFRSGFEAYHDVKAWKLIYEGCDYVRLVKGETVDVSITLYPIGDPNGCLD